jgi:hypothetical protein
MARIPIPVITMNRRALVTPVPVTSDAANDHFVVNDGATWLEIGNVAVGVMQFTVITPYLVDQDLGVDDRLFTVPGSTTVPVHVGPWPRSIYGETIFVDVPPATGTNLRFYAYSLLTS